jgi:hypothetical protein
MLRASLGEERLDMPSEDLRVVVVVGQGRIALRSHDHLLSVVCREALLGDTAEHGLEAIPVLVETHAWREPTTANFAVHPRVAIFELGDSSTWR